MNSVPDLCRAALRPYLDTRSPRCLDEPRETDDSPAGQLRMRLWRAARRLNAGGALPELPDDLMPDARRLLAHDPFRADWCGLAGVLLDCQGMLAGEQQRA